MIDGEVTSYFEWMGAGVYRVDERSGSMHGKKFLVKEVLFRRMRLRLLAAVFAVSLAATAQTPMTLAELYSFVQSSQQFIKEGKMTDRELAGFLSKSKLTERLDDRSVELLQGLGIGPKTLEALRAPARSIENPDRGRAD